MTKKNLLALFPGTKSGDWTKHENGGGWIQSTASVDLSVFLGDNCVVFGNAWVFGNAQVSGNARVFGDARVSGDARVFGNAWVFGDARVSGDARVFGNAWVFGNAQVSGNARVFGDARVSGDARVFGNAWVFGDARVSGDARVFGNAWVFGNAQVSGNAWAVTPLLIHGSCHSVSHSRKGHVTIGCHTFPIAHWEKHYRKIGAEAGYTPAQIKEYADYIALVKKADVRVFGKGKR